MLKMLDLIKRWLLKLQQGRHQLSSKDACTCAPATGKDVFDAQLDAQFGPEGGEGEQWPHSGL